jgi:hypothetical protein
MIGFFFVIVGAWLGWSISMDLSNSPPFPLASYAFVAFWTLVGTVLGRVVGQTVEACLDDF